MDKPPVGKRLLVLERLWMPNPDDPIYTVISEDSWEADCIAAENESGHRLDFHIDYWTKGHDRICSSKIRWLEDDNPSDYYINQDWETAARQHRDAIFTKMFERDKKSPWK